MPPELTCQTTIRLVTSTVLLSQLNVNGRVALTKNVREPQSLPQARLARELLAPASLEYLGGHSDLTGGAVIGPRYLPAPVWMLELELEPAWPNTNGRAGSTRSSNACVASPFSSWTYADIATMPTLSWSGHETPAPGELLDRWDE